MIIFIDAAGEVKHAINPDHVATVEVVQGTQNMRFGENGEPTDDGRLYDVLIRLTIDERHAGGGVSLTNFNQTLTQEEARMAAWAILGMMRHYRVMSAAGNPVDIIFDATDHKQWALLTKKATPSKPPFLSSDNPVLKEFDALP